MRLWLLIRSTRFAFGHHLVLLLISCLIADVSVELDCRNFSHIPNWRIKLLLQVVLIILDEILGERLLEALCVREGAVNVVSCLIHIHVLLDT